MWLRTEKTHTCIQQLCSVFVVEVGAPLPVIPASGLFVCEAKSLAHLLFLWAVLPYSSSLVFSYSRLELAPFFNILGKLYVKLHFNDCNLFRFSQNNTDFKMHLYQVSHCYFVASFLLSERMICSLCFLFYYLSYFCLPGTSRLLWESTCPIFYLHVSFRPSVFHCWLLLIVS